MTNKYLEKIASSYKVNLGKGEKAHLSENEYEKYRNRLEDNPGTGKKIWRGLAGGLFGGIGAEMAAGASGTRMRAVADAAGTAVGAVAGYRSGAAIARRNALAESKKHDK